MVRASVPKLSTRERIVSAAAERFHALGYSACGVQEIVDAAGVPKGSFYNYFKGSLWLGKSASGFASGPISTAGKSATVFSPQLRVEHFDALHPLKQLSVGQPKHWHPHRQLRVPKTQMTAVANLAVWVAVRTEMSAGKQFPHD